MKRQRAEGETEGATQKRGGRPGKTRSFSSCDVVNDIKPPAAKRCRLRRARRASLWMSLGYDSPGYQATWACWGSERAIGLTRTLRTQRP